VLWVTNQSGSYYSGDPHELWTAVAWAISAVVVVTRFATHQGARQAAAAALGGFAFLLFAVVGLELFV
jgi:ABC-type transport system involved in cytochrome c biogenesis permease subunit